MKAFTSSGADNLEASFENSNRGLRAVAIAAIAFCVLSVIGLAAAVYFSRTKSVENRLAEEERNIVAIATFVTEQYETLDRAIDAVADLFDGRDPASLDIAELSAIKARINKQFSAFSIEVNIWKPDGANATADDAVSIADRENFTAHFQPAADSDPRRIASTGTVIARPVLGRLRDFRVLPVSRAISIGGGPILAIVTATVPEEGFIKMFNLVRHTANDTIFLFRNDQIGLVRAPFDARFSGQHLPNALVFQNYPRQQAGRFEGPAATDGIRRVGVHYGLAPLPLVLGISFEVPGLSWHAVKPYAPFIAVGVLVFVAASGFALLAYLAMRRAVEGTKRAATERDRAISSAHRLRAVLFSANDGIITLDENLCITAVNRAAEGLFGVREAELLGGPLDPLLPVAMRERHAGLMRGMAQAPDISRSMSNWRSVKGLHASGREFPAMVSISKVTMLGAPMYLAVVRDMTDISAKEEELAQVAEEQAQLRALAEQSSAAKSKFLATMSHELRTPLNAIIGFSESIDMGIAGPADSPKHREYIKLILNSGRHLLSLINDILDLSRIQGGAALRNVEPVDLGASITKATLVLRSRIESKKITIVEEMDKGVEFRTDPRAMLQVLMNVIGNAVKFSPEGGRITLQLSRKDGGGAVIEVRDEGPGIPTEVMQRIGEPFLQARSHMVSDNEGTGLGLAITLELLKLMGGRLALHNIEPTGLRARIDLDPRAETDPAASGDLSAGAVGSVP